MDILTHIVSGATIGACAASFTNKKITSIAGLIITGTIAGALPDIDAISLWSKFDGTFGKFFGLSLSGKEIYSSKLWYSHHNFLHSAVAALLFSFLAGLIIFFISKKPRQKIKQSQTHIIVAIAFFLGYITHLVEDMFTPASVWGGVNFFWPSVKFIGGYGNIWWWNNYDIFLIIFTAFFINFSILTMNRYKKIPVKIITSGIILVAVLWVSVQIKNRDFDFNYTGFTAKYNVYEQKSLEIQKRILGKKLYNIMNHLDRQLKFNF